MLKKLYKHEFHLLFRSLFPIYAALVLFATMCRLTSLIDFENALYGGIMGFSTVLYVISILAMFIVGMVIIIVRFYKNLLSHEGYLSFSLPFTATQHIICKLICAVVMTIVNGLAVIGSLLIVGFGTDFLNNLLDMVKLLFEQIQVRYSTLRITLFFIEIAAMIIISIFHTVLMFYTAMAIGQQFKNKILGSVIAYIGLYMATETITTITVIPFILIYGNNVNDKINSGDITILQNLFLYSISLTIIIGIVYFFITRHFLEKKLNLE